MPMKPFDISPLQSLYNGFFLSDARGNNAFSFDQRENRRLWVAPLQGGSPGDLKIGTQTVFSEVEEGIEINRPGLEHFLYLSRGGKDIFIFDNHNHAFFFWMAGIKYQRFAAGLPLIHIDQHSDMRTPELPPPPLRLDETLVLQPVFEYTNYVLNVGNFIQPALQSGVFSSVEIVDGVSTLRQEVAPPYVLDIDLDIFAPEMNYIDEDWKVERIRACLPGAQFITMATSPYFIDQERAIRFVHRLLDEAV